MTFYRLTVVFGAEPPDLAQVPSSASLPADKLRMVTAGIAGAVWPVIASELVEVSFIPIPDTERDLDSGQSNPSFTPETLDDAPDDPYLWESGT